STRRTEAAPRSPTPAAGWGFSPRRSLGTPPRPELQTACRPSRCCRWAHRSGVGCRGCLDSARRCNIECRGSAMATETGQHAIDTMLLEERRYPPPEEFARGANAQPDIYNRSFESFWEAEGRERLTWFEPFSELYEWEPPYAKWFLGGTLNVCFNCVDRHVEAGK